jgi:hypothetical protein
MLVMRHDKGRDSAAPSLADRLLSRAVREGVKRKSCEDIASGLEQERVTMCRSNAFANRYEVECMLSDYTVTLFCFFAFRLFFSLIIV